MLYMAPWRLLLPWEPHPAAATTRMSPPGGNNGKDSVETTDKSLVNAERAIEIIDAAVENYFEGAGMSMARLYNPYNGKKSPEPWQCLDVHLLN